MEQLARRANAVQGEILAEIESRGVFAEYGYGTLAALQADVLNISRREAKNRTQRAIACNDARGVGSSPMPAAAPATGAATREGALSTEHIDVVLEVLAGMPAGLPPTERAGYEKTLVDLARAANPESTRKVGLELLSRLEQDFAPQNDTELASPDRQLHLTWRNGQLTFKGRLDTETGKAFETAISPLAKPRPTEDGQRDARTVAERNGDALAEVLELVLREGGLPTEAGEKPTLTVTMDIEQLRADIAAAVPALLNGDTPISAEQARRIACDADIIPAVLGCNGELLDLGRSERLVTRAQRRALNLRDKGCVFPGCTRSTRWTQAHHIRHWIDGGPSDLQNLCLLCTEHHRLIHHSEWDIRMSSDGRAECIPPPFFDLRRQPRRNHAHRSVERAA